MRVILDKNLKVTFLLHILILKLYHDKCVCLRPDSEAVTEGLGGHI
jgi:hypothetical protein